MSIKEVGYHTKSFLTWGLIAVLMPLGLYHKGFWNVFVFLSWLTFFGCFIMFLGGIVVTHVVNKEEEEECKTGKPKMSESDKDRALKTKMAKTFALPMAKKSGVDKVHWEAKQNHMDTAYTVAICLYLVFTGHVFLGICWMGTLIGRSFLTTALKSFDDALLDEI